MLQVAIVGCGAVAQRLYRKPLQELEKKGFIRVVALIDPVMDHAANLAVAFPGAGRFADLAQALHSTRIDLTVVLSPAHLHCDQTIAALRSGSNVLCEKPMATSVADCKRMNETATEVSRVLAIGMIRRFVPAFAMLKQAIGDGRLGNLRSFEYREGHKFEWDVTTPAAFKPRREGGTGVLFDIGPHVIDTLAWAFGDLEVLSYSDDALAGIESNISMQLASTRCTGLVSLSWDSPQLNELRVVGERAEAVVRVDRFDRIAIGPPGNYQRVDIPPLFPHDIEIAPRRISPKSYPQAVYCQLIQVIRAIRLNEEPAANGEAGRACVAVLEQALAIAKPLPAPWLSATEQGAFARLHWAARA